MKSKVTYYPKLYLVMLLAFLTIDAIWLGLIARGFYGEHLDYLLKSAPNWAAAFLFYLLFIAGLLVFVIVPNAQHECVKRVLVCGAFFGLVTFATYDLTNLALIRDWPLVVTVVDLAWGMVVGASMSCVGFFAARRLR
jgi:uncharacterized membrane protein